MGTSPIRPAYRAACVRLSSRSLLRIAPTWAFTVRSVTSLAGNAFSDPAVALNVNGVYLATPTTVHGLFFDLDRIDTMLSTDPERQGEEFYGDRLLVISPLAVIFAVRPGDRWVEVLQVWHR